MRESSNANIVSVADPVGDLPTISFALTEPGDLRVTVWNALGQRVSAFSSSDLAVGTYAISWDGAGSDGRPVAAGIYFVRIVVHGRGYTHKTVVLRERGGRNSVTYTGPVYSTSPASSMESKSSVLAPYMYQPLTAEDLAVLAFPASYEPATRHQAFAKALAQLQAGHLSRRELGRLLGDSSKHGGGRPGRALRGAAKPILLEHSGGLYQVYETQYVERFRGINLLGDAEQDGDVDLDDLVRVVEALQSADPYYDYNRNGIVDVWDLFAVVDNTTLRREGPFLLLNGTGLQLFEATVSDDITGSGPHLEFFNPGDESTPPAVEMLVRGIGNVLPAEIQRPEVEPFVLVAKERLDQVRLISPLRFWSGFADVAGASIPSYRFARAVLRENDAGAVLDGLRYVAFGYRMPKLAEDGELANDYEYSQVLVFAWDFTENFEGLPKLDTYPVHPDIDLGYIAPGPAAISQFSVISTQEPGHFRVIVNANRISFDVAFYVSQTKLELEELEEEGSPVATVSVTGSGFARQYEVVIPAGEWLLYGGLLVGGGNLAGLAVSPVSSTGPVPATEITFADARLEAAVRSSIAKPDGSIAPTDVASIEELVAANLGITELNGLELLVGLRRLDLSSNEIVNIDAIASLSLLRDLLLNDNQISDLSPLANLEHLEAVGLQNNLIDDLSALVTNSGLKLGDIIDLSGNPLLGTGVADDYCQLKQRRVDILGKTRSCGDLDALEFGDREKPILFFDLNLEASVREAIGKPDGDLFAADVRDLPDLRAVARGIVDLRGIERLEGLRTLDLSSNAILELEPLSALHNLSVLRLADNAITDLAPLAGLLQLDLLKLQRNRIRDISPLLANEGIRQGDNIDFCGNPLRVSLDQLRARSVVVDTSLVFLDANLELAVRTASRRQDGEICSGDVELLRSLNLNFGEVERLQGIEALVNLEELHAVGNQIEDIGPISTITKLTRLVLDSNRIADLEPLKGLLTLELLSMDGNLISSLEPLAELESLTSLTLSNNQIADLSPLFALANLNDLAIDRNQIVELRPLASHNKLRNLSIRYNQVEDLVPLASLTNLTTLWLDRNQISDLFALAALENLKNLSLDENWIIILSPLAELENLETLSLNSNLIENTKPLSRLVNLTSLFLSANQISDLEPLSGLLNLKTLLLDANQIVDISPLLSNPGLGLDDIVSVRSNPLGAVIGGLLLEQVTTLRSRGVDVKL